MNYGEADKLLQGRCKQSRKVANNTYLRRHADCIDVRIHATDVVTFWADGRVELRSGGWNTMTTKDRINRYLPRGWQLWSERALWILHWHKCASWQQHEQECLGSKEYLFQDGITIHPDGSVSEDGDLAAARREIREQDNERNREHKRLRYWLNKSRNGSAHKLTPALVMAEENVSVRLAKLYAYGVERFLMESGHDVVHDHAGYQLIRLDVGAGEAVRALKMECPSTGAVHISTVPPWLQRVPDALDWMFDCTDYLGWVGQQS
jgi:hypothetical protein